MNLVLPASASGKLGSGSRGRGGSSSKKKQQKVTTDVSASGSGKKGKKRALESPDDGRDQLDLLMKAASSTGTGHSFSSSDDGSKIGSAVKNKKKSRTKDPVRLALNGLVPHSLHLSHRFDHLSEFAVVVC
jgi:hypothetical protein